MAAERLEFAGFDFKIEQQTGEWWALECNPMPGFDFFDKQVGEAICKALLSYLTEIPDEVELAGAMANIGVVDEPFIVADRRPHVGV